MDDLVPDYASRTDEKVHVYAIHPVVLALAAFVFLLFSIYLHVAALLDAPVRQSYRQKLAYNVLEYIAMAADGLSLCLCVVATANMLARRRTSPKSVVFSYYGISATTIAVVLFAILSCWPRWNWPEVLLVQANFGLFGAVLFFALGYHLRCHSRRSGS